MKILLTGATGYIAQRLLPTLLEKGHRVVCCVRDRRRFNTENFAADRLEVIEADLLKKETLLFPVDIDAAYYLVHSMSSATGDFARLEALAAENFVAAVKPTNAKQIIYLSGIVNEKQLSKHLQSRKNVSTLR